MIRSDLPLELAGFPPQLSPSTSTLLLAIATLLYASPALAQKAMGKPSETTIVGEYEGGTGPKGLRGSMRVVQRTYRGDNDHTTTAVDLYIKPRGRRKHRALDFRIPNAYAKDHDYRFEITDLRDGRWLGHFVALPSDPALVADEPRYSAYITGTTKGTNYQLVWSGGFDPVDQRRRIKLDDLDGDGDLEIIEVTGNAPTLYCGKTAQQLFPKVWSYNQARFRPYVVLGKAVERLGAFRASFDEIAPVTSHFPNLVSFRTASSDLRDVKSGLQRRVSLPTDLGDGQPNTAWVEGAPGWGPGEFVTADINRAFGLRGLRIVPGYGDLKKVDQFGSPKTVLVALEDRLLRVDLPSVDMAEVLEQGGLYVGFPEPIRSGCMTVIVAEVYPASKPPRATAHHDGKRTAISELTPLLDLDYEPRQAAIARLVDAIIAERSNRRRRALVALASGLGDELGQPVSNAFSEQFAQEEEGKIERLLPLLPLVGRETGETIVAALLEWEHLSKADLTKMRSTVNFAARGYQDQLLRFAADNQAPDLVRSRAIHIVSRSGSPNRMGELVPMVGTGSTGMRKDVIRGLARADLKVIDALLDVAADKAGTTASHDALWAIDRLARKLFQGKANELTHGEKVFAAYTGAKDIQTRIRAMRLLNRVTVQNGDIFLATVLASSERAEVRVLAADALSNYRSERSTAALIKALDDEWPSVRIQSVRALRTRPNLPEVVAATDRYARIEDWEVGIEQAFLLLADSSARQGADYLYQLVDSSTPARAQAALRALEASRKNIRATELIDVAEDRTRPLPVRRLAVKCLTWTKDKPSEVALLSVLRDDQENVKLRRAVLRTFGRRQSDAALHEVKKYATSDADPVLQRTAIRVLGYYTSREVLTLLKELRPAVGRRARQHVDRSIGAIQTRLKFKKVRDALE